MSRTLEESTEGSQGQPEPSTANAESVQVQPPACPLCGYTLRSNGFCSNSRCDRQPPVNGSIALGQLHDLFPKVPLMHGRRWGVWHLDTERLTLDYKPDGVWRYELDLERNHDSASILDFIFQVRQKGWATPTVLADLLNAIQDIFHPQPNLCSCGRNKQVSAEFAAGRVEAVEQLGDGNQERLAQARVNNAGYGNGKNAR